MLPRSQLRSVYGGPFVLNPKGAGPERDFGCSMGAKRGNESYFITYSEVRGRRARTPSQRAKKASAWFAETPARMGEGRVDRAWEVSWVFWRCDETDVFSKLEFKRFAKPASRPPFKGEPAETAIRLLETAQRRSAKLSGCTLRPAGVPHTGQPGPFVCDIFPLRDLHHVSSTAKHTPSEGLGSITDGEFFCSVMVYSPEYDYEQVKGHGAVPRARELEAEARKRDGTRHPVRRFPAWMGTGRTWDSWTRGAWLLWRCDDDFVLSRVEGTSDEPEESLTKPENGVPHLLTAAVMRSAELNTCTPRPATLE